VDISQLRALFTKPYGAPAPTEQQWREAYSEDVVFEDPTQKKKGLKAYLDAQEGLLRRCDDVFSNHSPLPATATPPSWSGRWA